MEIKLTHNLKDAVKLVGDMAKNLKDMDGEHTIALSELFSDEFVAKHTSFKSWEEMRLAAVEDWSTRKILAPRR